MKQITFLAAVLLIFNMAKADNSTQLINHHDAEEKELDTHDLGIFNDIEKLININKHSQNKFFGNIEPFLGLPMRYPTYPSPMAENNIGIATRQGNMQIVIYGPRVASMLGPQIMGFFIQHEYAHHDNTNNGVRTQNSATWEAAADCEAAKYLVRQGHMEIIPIISNWFAQRGCNYDPRTPIESVTDSHPCGIQRANIIQQCSRI